MVRLASLRLVQQLQRIVGNYAYGDLAYLIKQIGTGAYDENNTETMTTVEIPLECSFTEKPSMEIWRDYADIGQVDAEIRFVGHDPQKGDTVKTASRFDGISHSNDTFEIVGINNRYAFGYVVALRKVAV
jgi:hypothetical protein